MADAAIEARAWVCPTCKVEVLTPFCGRCGERPVAPRDLTLRGVFERIVHVLTSVDGRVLRSAWRLVRHPGSLTVAYLAGARKPYASPVSLFLIANVLFFGVQSLTSTNIFGSSLHSHVHQQDWSALAQTLLQDHLQRTQSTLEIYAPVFDRASVLYAKSLVFLMVLPFALVLALTFVRKRQPMMCHLVFSLHLYAWLLLVFSVAVLLAGADVLLGGAGLQSATVDNVLSLLNFAACLTYLYLAMRPVYSTSRPVRALAAILLSIAVAAIALGYRFVLFLITLHLA